MSKDDTAPKADEQPVPETPKDEPKEPKSEVEQAIDDIAEGVEGEVVENPDILGEEDEDADTEDEKPAGEEEKPAEEEAASSSDAGESEPESESAEPSEELKPEKDETKEPEGVYAPPVPDPGEFQPKGDYSFEFTTTDGKTIKINNPEEADAFAKSLDDSPDLISASEFLKFNRNVARMDVAIDGERRAFDADKERFESQQVQENIRNQQVTQWNNEINYLRNKGMLPAITPELNTANWLDPKNAEQAPVKEALAIFKWMEKENTDRRSAKIPEITSAVDAFRLMQAEQKETQAKDEKKSERSTRQKKGSMVGSNAPFTPSNSPKDTIIGTGGTLNDYLAEEMAEINS